MIMSAVLFSLKASEFFERTSICYIFNVIILIIFWRFIAIQLIKLYRKSGYNYSKIVIVGGGEVAKQLHNYFNSDDVLGVKLMGVFSDTDHTFHVKDGVIIGTINKLGKFVLENSIDEIFYTLPLTHNKKIKSLVDFCDKQMIRFKNCT